MSVSYWTSCTFPQFHSVSLPLVPYEHEPVVLMLFREVGGHRLHRPCAACLSWSRLLPHSQQRMVRRLWHEHCRHHSRMPWHRLPAGPQHWHQCKTPKVVILDNRQDGWLSRILSTIMGIILSEWNILNVYCLHWKTYQFSQLTHPAR